MFVLPLVVRFFPTSWETTLQPYLPSEAGSRIFSATGHVPGQLDPWTGFGVFLIWAVAAIIIGAVLLKRRDA
jgi:hypothetical protein